jgi:hypothetical protein
MRKRVVRIRFVAIAGLSAAERPVGFVNVILLGLRLGVDLKIARKIQ